MRPGRGKLPWGWPSLPWCAGCVWPCSSGARALCQSGRLPEDAIGGAVSSTNIQVAGGVDLSPLLLVAAAVGLVGAVFFAFWLLRKRKG